LGDLSKLIRKRKTDNDDIKYFVLIEETYDIIKKAHLALNHAGRDKMQKEINRKYANITLNCINLYKSVCEECQLRRKNPSKGVVVKPIVSKDFNSRGQVDLVDMQSMPDGNYRFIMNYQDYLTTFCIIEALSSKRAAEVAYKILLNIYLVFGAPHILQSDNGREFTAEIIKEQKVLWPDLAVVYGKPQHPQWQGSVERSNADIHDMIVSWMRDNDTTKWAVGLKFIQFQKNRRFHEGIKRSLYEAMFGSPPKVGLTTSKLPNEILNVIEKEEELVGYFMDQPSQSTIENQAVAKTPVETVLTLLEFEHECKSRTTVFQSDTENCDLCDVCSRGMLINRERHLSHENLERQADKMVAKSNQVLQPVTVGNNVTLPVPSVDRGRGDSSNMMCVVIDINTETQQYKLATRYGLLNGSFSRNQFLRCTSNILLLGSVDFDTEISVRQAARK
jgi:hypothetical protein